MSSVSRTFPQHAGRVFSGLRKPPGPSTPEYSRRAVLALYRKIVRLMPNVLRAYQIEGDAALPVATSNVRKLFEQQSNLKDTSIVDVLRHKAEMEIGETLLMYKTKSHVYGILMNPVNPTPGAPTTPLAGQTQFMSNFLTGNTATQ